MTKPTTSARNNKIALVLAIVGGVLFLALLIAVYVAPLETLKAADKANIKVLLLFLGFFSITALGVLIYWAFHTPTVKRVAVISWRSVLVYTAMACGFSIFGWPKLKTIDVDPASGLKAEFDPFATSLETWPNLAICFAGIVVTTYLYIYAGELEAKYGREL